VGHFRGSENPDTVKSSHAVGPQAIPARRRRPLFITFSCYRREAYFTTTASKDIFLDSLELTRKRYYFEVLGYAIMRNIAMMSLRANQLNLL